MSFMQMLAANFWTTVILMLFLISMVSIVLGIWLEAYKVKNKSSQKMLELRNEELRLRLKLEQQKRGTQAGILEEPKEPSWEEQSQTNYEMGYQQLRQQ
jgi:hypothetical protein